MINVSKYTIHDSILSNFQFMCCLFSSSPKKLPQKNKSKHHHHHKIIQIKTQNPKSPKHPKSKNRKNSTMERSGANSLRKPPCRSRQSDPGSPILWSSRKRHFWERKTGSCGISRGKSLDTATICSFKYSQHWFEFGVNLRADLIHTKKAAT